MKVVASYGVPRSSRTRIAALVAAGMMTTMLVAQLFSYEDLPTTLSAVLPFNDLALTATLAGLLVIAELISLPYLLGMYVSLLMRVVSGVCAVAVSIFWLFISFTNAHADNSALFGTAIHLPGGLLAALWSIVLFGAICAVVVADSRFRHNTAS